MGIRAALLHFGGSRASASGSHARGILDGYKSISVGKYTSSCDVHTHRSTAPAWTSIISTAMIQPITISSLLVQLEQELASFASSSVSVPLGLLASVCAAVAVAALLVQISGSKQRRSAPGTGKTGAAEAQHAVAAPALGASSIANGFAQSDVKLAVAADLPTPEQLSKLIRTRRSIFPKVSSQYSQRTSTAFVCDVQRLPSARKA